jgi:beta-glucanase (GH16 family)
MEANIANGVNSTEEFHRPFFFIINLAVGGQWPGYPDGSTPSSASMYVDYVRVYQK